MSLAHSLSSIANDPAFADNLVALAANVKLTADETTRLHAYIQRKRWNLTSLAKALGDAGNEEELYRCLASACLEQEMEWQRQNMVLSYQAVRTGEPEPLTFVLASVNSTIMAKIESLMTVEDRTRWQTFAVDIIAGTAAALTERFGGSHESTALAS